MNFQTEKQKMLASKTNGVAFLSEVQSQLDSILLGRSKEIKLTLTAFLADGHVLLDGLPGVGKTVFAEAIAKVLGLKFGRVQFTSDLLPADLIGASIFDQQNSEFTFHKGPIFTEILLVDEINRAGPKVQSALLEAMAEKQVSHDGSRNALSSFFFTLATRNPGQQLGTFPMPEAQLDRFLFRLNLVYPNRRTELKLLQLGGRKMALNDIMPVLERDQLAEIRNHVSEIKTSDVIYDYVMDLIEASRDGSRFEGGLSSRAGILLISASRAHAWLSGRDHVLPDDIQAVFSSLSDHRLLSVHEENRSLSSGQILVETVPVP